MLRRGSAEGESAEEESAEREVLRRGSAKGSEVLVASHALGAPRAPRGSNCAAALKQPPCLMCVGMPTHKQQHY